MEQQKGKKIKWNVISGIVYQVVILSLGFLLPRLYLENFGSQVNGVLSTIKQIFSYLTLLEAGVGLATTQALYGPVAGGNRGDINSILAATKKYYCRTGVIYTGMVLVISVVYAFLIPTGLDSWVVLTLFILNGLPSVFSYFIQAKYRLLLEADGKKYIITNSDTVVQLLSGVAKILILVLTDSLILIQLAYCLIAIGQLTYIYLYARRSYRWLDLSCRPNTAAVEQKNSVLVHHLSAMVFNNTDILLISFFCDFTVVSVYSIYNMFFTQVQALITSVVSGFTFALGQLFQTDREQFKKVYSAYEALYIMVTFFVYTLMCVFLLPLIRIYTGGIQDANYNNPMLIMLFVAVNLLSNGKLPSNQLIEFAGEFRKTKWHSIAEMVINLSASVLGIWLWGICGALAGTVVALAFRAVLAIRYANKKILDRSVLYTYRHWILNGAVFLAVFAIFRTDFFSGCSFWRLLLNGVIHAIWIGGVYLAVNLIFRKEDFQTVIALVRGRKKA